MPAQSFFTTGTDRRSLLMGVGACAAVAAAGIGHAESPLVPALAVRRFAIDIGPGSIRYRTEAGEMLLRNAHGTPQATIFAASYLSEELKASTRPVTFVFNGGPGGSSWPLHTTLSPKKLARAATPQGYAIVANVDSPIDQTDLVFVDAPGTGFSRMLTEGAKADYWGIEQDAQAVSHYIEDWLRRHRRTSSPVYLIGESYGGTRVAQILRILALSKRVRFGGVVLISPTLGGNGPFLDGMDADRLSLPTLAATSRYYGRGDYNLLAIDAIWQRGVAFADGAYARALAQGAKLAAGDAELIAAQLAAFTGIAPDTFIKARLRMPIERYRDTLLKEQGERMRLFDAREHVAAPPPGTTVSVVQTADGYDLQAAILDLLRNELGYATTAPYRRDPDEASRRWNNRLIDTPWRLTEVLQAVASADPSFGILLVGGYFDLVVPHMATRTAFDAAKLPPGQFQDIVYPTGHAVYSDSVVRPLASDDLRAFYRSGSVLRTGRRRPF